MRYFLYIISIILTNFIMNNSYSQKYVIITDVDDTIKITSVMAGDKEFIKNVIQTKAFYSMSDLFQLFIESKNSTNILPDRNILYVTGAPGILGYPALHFLQVNMFPLATKSNFIGSSSKTKIDKTFFEHEFKEIKDSIKSNWNSPGSQSNDNAKIEPMFPFATSSDFINKKINNSILNGKLNSIKPIIENNPDTNFILLGDNGQLDPDVYKQIQDLYPNRVRVFIHHVYEGSNKITVNYSYTNTRKRFEIYNNQTPYYTAADLAVQFYNIGMISREDVLKILENSIQAIDPTQGVNAYVTKNQELFYQSWMTGCLGFMNTEWNKLVMSPMESDSEMSKNLTYLKNIIISYSGCTPKSF